ncbi:hypothetical protein GQ53DRAFT_528466 [Thozetella sp. PMI_491]|nr:hypothetical protein GQ53DRAFT_528466 [Thozetella sp. PMI_491]
MRLSVFLSSLAPGLIAATPLAPRQDIDFDAYDLAAIHATAVIPPVGDIAPQNSAAYDPTNILSLAVAQVTAGPDATQTVDVVAKRAVTACTTRTYNGPRITSPADTPEAFLSYQPFKDAANAAAKASNIPQGYHSVPGFINLQATIVNTAYLTYVSSRLQSYDVSTCASVCDGIAGCNSFAIFYERAPLVVSNSTQAPDATLCPATSTSGSATLIKCTFYGQPVLTSQATNAYQYWGTFKTVYAGSNAYARDTPATIDGYQPPVAFNNSALSAPVPASSNGFLWTQTFGANVPFDPSLCAASCNAQTSYNAESGTNNGSACVFFNAFILYKNGQNGVFTCNYYSIEYDSSFATNTGSKSSTGATYTIDNSYGYYIDLDLRSTCSSVMTQTTTTTINTPPTSIPLRRDSVDRRSLSISASASASALYSACSWIGSTPTVVTVTATYSQSCQLSTQTIVLPCSLSASTITTTLPTTQTAQTPTTTVVVNSTLTPATETETSEVPYPATTATEYVTTTFTTVNVQSTITSGAVVTETTTITSWTNSTTPAYYFSSSPSPTVVPRNSDSNALRNRAQDQCSVVQVTVSTCSGAPGIVTSTVFSTGYTTPATVTEMSTQYVSVTGLTTVTSSKGFSVTVNEDVLVAATWVLDPTTITTTSTTTATVTVMSTTAVPQPHYCKMHLRASGGTFNGSYIIGEGMNNIISNTGSKMLYELDSTGRLHPLEGTAAGKTAVSFGETNYQYLATDAQLADRNYGYRADICQIDSSTLVVKCVAWPTTLSFSWFDGYSTSGGYYLWLGTWVQSGSIAFTLMAEPVACVL